jgi:hypothetical protein
LLNKIKKKLQSLLAQSNTDELKKLSAQILVRENKKSTFSVLSEAEFKVFSQWGEDGIIQYLINKIPIKNNTFVEFGVENYTEANTKFLLENDNWSGLVLDGSSKHVESIKKSKLYWKYDLTAKNIFITKDNIDGLLKGYIDSSGFDKEIGLLSIDIDGNDYYVWDAIRSIEPVIVVCEYNWIFGNQFKLTVPYDDLFVRTTKHHSNLYFGASIQSLYSLAKSKGYEYVGCTKAGNDAFFVKKEYADRYIKELITTPAETFNEQKAKESRDKDGKLTFFRGKERIQLIKDMEVLNLETNEIVELNTLFEMENK